MDFNNRHLKEMESFLSSSLSQASNLTEDDLDPREIIYQLIEAIKQNTCFYGDGIPCVPNLVVVVIPETKADRVEDLETIFNRPTFLKLLSAFLYSTQLRIFNPLFVDVQTVSKGNSRVMYRRASLGLEWPRPELASEQIRVEINYRNKQIINVIPQTPEIPQLARLTALNSTVYHNRYVITKKCVRIGRLRTIVNENGKMIRRNDFVFAHQDSPEDASNSVSRQHASIVYQHGIFNLIDHGSINGTIIQRLRTKSQLYVTPQHVNGIPLEDGDMIRFGSAWVNFEFVPKEVVTRTPVPFLPEPN